MISLLKATNLDTIELVDQNQDLVIKGKTSDVALNLKLPVMPLDATLFEMPAPQDRVGTDHRPLINAIAACLPSTSTDTTIPDMLGVTLIPKGKQILTFSTNSSTFTHSTVPNTIGLTKRVILSSSFCEQLVKLAGDSAQSVIDIENDHAIFRDSEGTVLFGKLISSRKPIDYEEILEAHLPANLSSSLAPIDEHFKSIINRAVIIADNKVNQTFTKITVQKGEIYFSSRSDGYGEILDKVKAPRTQKEASIKIHPSLIKDGLNSGGYDHYLLTNRCAIMTKGDGQTVFLVASLA